MKCLLIVLAAAACCQAGNIAYPAGFGYSPLAYGYSGHNLLASPYAYSAGVAHAPAVAAVHAAPYAYGGALKSQYHAQDEFGQASYGYAHPGQAHSAFRDAAGHVTGSYAYINPEGREIRVDYVADEGGFRVASNALPEGPSAPVVPTLVGPAPVADTAEVVEARNAHLAAVAEVRSRQKRGVALTTPAATVPLAYAAHPLAYSTLGHHAYSPLAYSSLSHGYSPLAYSGLSHGYSPLAYSGLHAYSPLGYAAAAPLVREATKTTIVNNPGHAISYRID